MLVIVRDYRDGKSGANPGQPAQLAGAAAALDPLDLGAEQAVQVWQRFGRFYQDLIENGIKLVQSGTSGGWGTNTEWIGKAGREELAMAKELGLSQDNALAVRHLLLSSEVLAQLRLLQKEDANLAEQILSKVRDRTIDALADFNNRSGQPSLLDPDLRAELGKNYLGAYLRPLVFLSIIKANPELADELKDNSSYIIHTHLAKPQAVAPSKVQIIRDTDRLVADQLLSMISEDFGNRLIEAAALFTQVPATSTPGSRIVAGKYSIQRGLGIEFAGKFPQETGDKLEKLFGTYEAKREIMSTIAEIFDFRISTLAANTDEVRALLPDKRSRFALLKFQYAAVKSNLEMYAHNQLVYAYKQSGVIAAPYIARLMGIRAEAGAGEIILRDRQGAKRTVSNAAENPYYNTNQDLAVCIAALSMWYISALAVCGADGTTKA